MSVTTSPRGNSTRASSGIRAYVPYAILGTLTCIVAILVAEVFVQAMQPPPVADSLTISLLIDTSGSMRGESIAEVRDASIRFLKTWDRPNTHIAVIPFSDDALIMEPILTMDDSDNPLIPKLQELEASGGTSMLSALEEAQVAFQHVGAVHNAVMLFTDGQPNKSSQTLRTAQRMKERGTMVVAIGTAGADDAFLEELAGNPENVFTTRLGDFADTFDLAAEIISEGSFGTATTSQGLVVVLVVSLFLAAAMLVAENVWGLRGRWWRDLWWLPATGGIAGYAGGMVGEYVLGLGIVTWGLVGTVLRRRARTDGFGRRPVRTAFTVAHPAQVPAGCPVRSDWRFGRRVCFSPSSSAMSVWIQPAGNYRPCIRVWRVSPFWVWPLAWPSRSARSC